MALREITTFPDNVLRKKAKQVEVFDDNLQQLIEDMVVTMREAPGVGLAAPQIGVAKRVIVVEFGHESEESIPKPGFAGEVNRSQVVTIRGQDSKGAQIKIRAEGWLARIFQHEIDHVNGVLYTDRADNLWQPDAEETASI